MSSQHSWPEEVPVTGVRKCLDSVRFCWLMEYIPEGLCDFFSEPKPKWVLLLSCVQGIMQRLCLRLSCGGTSPQPLTHRENGVLDWAEPQGLRKTPVAKKGHKKATGFLLSSH